MKVKIIKATDEILSDDDGNTHYILDETNGTSEKSKLLKHYLWLLEGKR